MKRMVLLALALTVAAGCAPSFRREAEVAYKGVLVLEAATEPARDFDADGDGLPEDPAETRAQVLARRAELRELMRELVLAADGDPDAVEVEIAKRLAPR